MSRSVTLRKQKSAYDCMRKSGRVIMARQAGWHRRIIIILSQHLAGAGFFYCLILERSIKCSTDSWRTKVSFIRL